MRHSVHYLWSAGYLAIQYATRWDVLVELLPLLNTLLLLGRYLMPRAKGTQPPDNLKPSEYPAWFAEYSDAQDSDEGAIKWLRDYEADDLKQLVLAVLSSGGGLFIARTRDGGALSLTVTFGDAKKRWYVTSGAALDELVTRMS